MQIEQNSLSASPSQQWTLIAIGNSYEIKNVNSGKALDVTGLSLHNGALLQQWDYLATANQQWQLSPVLY